MKKLFTIFAAVLLTVSVFAQSPEKMSYQSVIRDANNYLITNQSVGIRISLLQGSSSGTVIYTETQTATSNRNGLVTIEIGAGTTDDDFSSIDWANGPYFILCASDPAGGTSYTITGTSQLLSVPYALHAKTVEIVNETDPAYTSSPAAGITAADLSNLGNLSGVNTGDQDISGLATTSALGDSTASVRSAIPDVSGFVSSEADPVYTGSQAANITAGDISNLDNLSGVNTGDQDLSTLATRTALGDSTALVRSEIPDVSGYVTSESDPVYTASEAVNITAADITNLGNLSGTNTGDQDGSETIVTAGTNVNISGSGTTASPYVVNASGSGTLASIGDSYGGGIIFWLDASGQHGLIAATTDQSTGIQWYNGSSITTGATIDAVYSGRANTDMITAIQGPGSYAAQLCADYSVTVNNEYYDDWYLPSLYELHLLYLEKDAVGGFEVASYWSSTENNNTTAWLHGMNSGIQLSFTKDGVYHVRAIRAF